MKITIGTTYYDRPEELLRLCRSISKTTDSVTHVVVDDGSPREHGIESVVGELKKIKTDGYNIRAYRKSHGGRAKYKETLQFLWDRVKKTGGDYFVMLPDDVIVCENFFRRVKKLIGKLPKDFILNFMLDSRSKDTSLSFFDGMGIMPWHIMDNIRWRVPDPVSRSASSGVFQNLTRNLLRSTPRAKVYFPTHSLTYHFGSESKMNPVARAENPIKTLRRIDDCNNPNLDIRPLYELNKSDKNYLFRYRGGIGNSIQAVGLYLNSRHLIEDNWDVMIEGTSPPPDSLAFYDKVAKHFGNECYSSEDDLEKRYEKKYDITFSTSVEQAECDHYLELSDEFCPPNRLFYEQHLPLDWHKISGAGKERYDVIINNGGYEPNARWLRKKYRRYTGLAKKLTDAGYTVASVGLPEQYIYGTIDKVRLNLSDTFDLISNCRLFISNDTGLYHFANAIGKDNIVIFTATSIKKNYHSVFHAFATSVHGSCHSCQKTKRWDRCSNWDCCYQEPEKIFKIAEAILEAKA